MSLIAMAEGNPAVQATLRKHGASGQVGTGATAAKRRLTTETAENAEKHIHAFSAISACSAVKRCIS